MHNCLECLGLSLAEYARYSPLLYFPLFVLPDWPLQSTLEPRSPSTPEAATTTSRPPETKTRSSSEVPRQEACAFSIVVDFVLAFLRQLCVLVSVLRYYCFRWHLYVSSWYIFEPSWPLACIIQLVLFTLLELCCDIPPWHPDLDHVPCVYDYCTWS